MKNHWVWMVIGCGVPLLLIFLAPSFGIEGGSPFLIFIIAMFAIHLFMPHGAHGHNENSQNHNQKKSTEKHNEHQHH